MTSGSSGSWDELYREEILEHYRHPRHRGALEHPDYTYEDANPLCGDRIRMDVKVADGRVVDVGFSGEGCAISQAATSMLCERHGARFDIRAGSVLSLPATGPVTRYMARVEGEEVQLRWGDAGGTAAGAPAAATTAPTAMPAPVAGATTPAADATAPGATPA